MKTIFLILFLLFCPLIAGYGAVSLYNTISGAIKKGKETPEKPFFLRVCTAFPIGVCIMLLLAGICNVLTVFVHLDLSAGKKLFAALLIAVLTVFYFVLVISRMARALKKLNNPASSAEKSPAPGASLGAAADTESGSETRSKKNGSKLIPILITVSALLSVFLIFLALKGYTDYSGDQTLETVNSFISTGKLYSVDPLTGLPYTNGYPSRLSLMVLPFFYAVLCQTFSVSPMVLLWYIIPVYFMITGFMIFVCLGDALFKERKDKLIFYMICVFLLLCSNVSIGSPGFDILHAGFRGSTFLNIILLNLTFCFCIKRKWVCCLLPVILEPLVASTAFGAGAAFFVTVIMLIISKLPLFRRLTNDTPSEKGGDAS